ncbi:MAG: ABC transporter ATP-binding protein [Lachnospiraceae bacterium]|nr:ABC transporter ATP-binding protein [Lachnospiraceae bacterium]
MKDNRKKIILQCQNISKTYPGNNLKTEVLRQVNLQFNRGTINLIYWKSGSGKSTLLNILAGLDEPSQGDICYEGINYRSMGDSKKAKVRGENFGFIFQAYHLIPRINVKENILCPSYVNGKQYDHEYFEMLVEMMGIKKLLNNSPFALSGGEQQRVAIARAMLMKPKIVFADEPTGNLDTENTRIITELFDKLHKECNTTFIIVTHEENLIENCEQIIRIKDGEVSVV